VQPKAINFNKPSMNLFKYNNKITNLRTVSSNIKVSGKYLTLNAENINQQDPIFKDSKNRTGLPSISKFYQNMGMVDKLEQMDVHKEKDSVAYMAEITKLPVVPSPMGIVSHKGENNQLRMTNYSMGNAVSKAVGKAIFYSKAEKLSMQNNRLSPMGALNIIKNINPTMKEIDLSGNTLQDYEKTRELKVQKYNNSPYGKWEAKQKKKNIYNLQWHWQPKKKLAPGEVDSDEEPDDESEEDNCNLGNTSSDAVMTLCKQIADYDHLNIEALYLNNCKLRDEEIILLLNAVKDFQNTKIKKLYFNENQITSKGALGISEVLLDKHLKLKEVSLKWNKIDSVGGNAIALALETNTELKILDLSWNIVGKPNSLTKIVSGDIGRAWGSAMMKNSTLVHLDLSFNKIGELDTINLSEDIVFNQSLVGLHFNGNTSNLAKQQGRVDSCGFLKV